MPRNPANPGRYDAQMYLGTFLMFGALSMMIGFLQPRAAPWPAAVLLLVFGGTIAAGWAYAFTARRFWVLVPLIILPWLSPWWLFRPLGTIGFFDVAMGGSELSRKITLFVLMVVFTSVGFTLFIRFVRGKESDAQRAQAELDVARVIHESIVPPIDLATPFAEVLAKSVPSTEMGGDLVDVVRRDHELDVFLADVSGHGVGAGIVMSMLKASIRTRLLAAGDDLGLVLRDVNRITADLTRPEMFATLACARVRADRSVSYALAGHLPIFRFVAAQRRWSRLENEHLPLGIDADVEFTSGSLQAAVDDVLVFLTDGLVEVMDPNGQQFGLDRIASVLESVARATPAAIAQALMDAAGSHGAQTDDQSVLIVRIL